MKYIGIGFIIITAILLGFNKSKFYSNRVDELEKILKLIFIISSKIKFVAMSIDELFASSEIKNLDLSFTNNLNSDDIKGSLSSAIGEYKSKKLLTNADYSLLSEFIYSLGTTDIEGQVAHCSLYESLFKSQLETAKQERNEKSKMVFTLYTMGGLAISLILI